MGIVIKQGIKSSVISYIGIGIGTFNVLWLFPKFLDPEKIGLLRILQDISFLLALLVQLGAHGIIDKFFFHFADNDKKNNGFFFIVLLYPLIGFTVFTFVFFGFYDFWLSFYTEKSTILLKYFYYIYPLTFVTMYIGIMEIYLRANLKISYSNFLREILMRLLLFFIVVLYVAHIFNIDGLILALVGSNILILLLITLYVKQVGILYLQPKLTFLNRKLLTEILSYVLFMIPGTMGALMIQKIDNLMLGAISTNGLSDVAIYSLAYFIGTVVEVPRKSITQISIPILSKAAKENDLTTINTLYKKISLNQFIIGAIIFICIWVNVDDLLNLIPNHEKYASGKYVILFIGLAKLTDMATSINSEIIQLTALYKFNIIAMVFLGITTVISNLLLIPEYNIVGASIAYAISILLFNLLKTYYIWKKMKIHPFSTHFIHLAIMFIIILYASFLLPEMKHTILQSLFSIVGKSIAIIALYFITIRHFNISEDMNTLIDKILLMIRNKIAIKWIKKNP
jgi:O-antigen/teichoic acid export membrane protein